MTNTVKVGALEIAPELHDFVRQALAGTGVEEPGFWASLQRIHGEFSARNERLLDKRDDLQSRIDGWWREQGSQGLDIPKQRQFLESIGYLVPEPPGFQIDTDNVDPEIARVAASVLH